MIMPCENPYYVESYATRVDGYRYSSSDELIPVPCGKCPRCQKVRVLSWCFRLTQQEKVSQQAHFVTLTYAPDHVPISRNGFMTLEKPALQKFFKRLRARCPGRKVKYYAVGEYGERFQRPHYHIILFNADELSIMKSWRFGTIDVDDVNWRTIAYTVSYIDKMSTVPAHRNDDRQKEFSLMSKGLGKSYINDRTERYHKADLERNYLTLPGGAKIPLPRYYRNKIYDRDELLEQREIIEQRQFEQQAKTETQYYEENPHGDFEKKLAHEKRARANFYRARSRKQKL